MNQYMASTADKSCFQKTIWKFKLNFKTEIENSEAVL